MSKNITIQEGGVGRQFTADKLKTALVGGGSCNWVPEDEVGLSTLSVTENGTYSASDEGKYGYSRVNVNVPGGAGGLPGGVGSSIKGVDPTTGNESLVTVDEDGNIDATELPSSITVKVPPARTNYYDGQTIDYTGLQVQALLKSGGAWEHDGYPNGMIPFSELVLPVTEASSADASEIIVPAGTIYVGSESFTGPIVGKIVGPIGRTPVSTAYHYDFEDAYKNAYALERYNGILTAFANIMLESGDRCICAVLAGGQYVEILFASDANFGGVSNMGVMLNDDPNSVNRTAGGYQRGISQFTYDNRTVYYETCRRLSADVTNFTIEPSAESANKAAIIAWYMVYGDSTFRGEQEIPVQWECQLDHRTHETSFSVEVEDNQQGIL